MDNGYYSVSSILAESQTIQTKFLNKCPGLGYLNPDAGHQEMEAGAQVRVPFWLAKALNRRNTTESTLPRHFRAGSGQYRSQLRMDPSGSNLNEKDPYFFLRGKQFSELFDDDDLSKDLKDIYSARFKHTVDICNHAADNEYSSSVRNLDSTERNLFDAGRRTALQAKEWKAGRLNRHSPY